MKMLIPLNSGDEQDALTPWRHYLGFKAGERKSIKKRYNKRLRRFLKKECK